MFGIHRKWTRRAGPEPEVFLFRWRCGRGLGVLIARFVGEKLEGSTLTPAQCRGGSV